MRTLRTLKPGQAGTNRPLARNGANLLCVRYRYDGVSRRRLKSLELIVQRRSPAAEDAPPAAVALARAAQLSIVRPA